MESRNPMPRPMPDSNMDAERDRLKVTMHWYGFQVLTIRSTCGSPVVTWRAASRSVPGRPQRREVVVDLAGAAGSGR